MPRNRVRGNHHPGVRSTRLGAKSATDCHYFFRDPMLVFMKGFAISSLFESSCIPIQGLIQDNSTPSKGMTRMPQNNKELRHHLLFRCRSLVTSGD